ncbi:hypothetical protein Tco_1553793 [Tanacetum coccineum]
MGARLQRMWTPLGHCRGGGEGSGAEVEGHEGETRGGLEGGGWKDVGVSPSWEDHWGHCGDTGCVSQPDWPAVIVINHYQAPQITAGQSCCDTQPDVPTRKTLIRNQ